ncbi:hypothetical protein [Actinosynnema pretiosum]|uniref:Uncharacterized protein n=1 Tax=Actinosynnema pretiosum TaxID=42197 RepID=A0A290Z940_9PSEU|nr:hypothetical protein [Actinosynnema pretiosum]ATE55528.1 hypothetical protein CNX65_21420 [Actinosynnema pretiosum]
MTAPRHDLIGFDPRGIGHSAAIECAPPEAQPDPASSTKDKARALAEADAARNRECAAGDPDLTRSLKSLPCAEFAVRLFGAGRAEGGTCAG